jgi:cell division protein FtsB
VAAALVFAVQGGEYSTPQWLELRAKERAERERIAELIREVDSLKRLKKLVETDPATQERYARELYGMLKKGEVQYTVIRPGDK